MLLLSSFFGKGVGSLGAAMPKPPAAWCRELGACASVDRVLFCWKRVDDVVLMVLVLANKGAAVVCCCRVDDKTPKVGETVVAGPNSPADKVPVDG